MRLNQKQEVLSFITTLEKAMAHVGANDNDNHAAVLKDCNEGLVILSNFMSEEQHVHALLQDAIATVHFLTAETKETDLFASYINKLKRIMNDVRHMVVNEVKTEIEIAFMPYKTAMWDALESIYIEAQNDPDCTCYVVPIPYYERNSEGDIVKFHYEGNQFPKDVNTIPFELYDFENRRPDIIYIHNPFDQYNALTMVNQRFFSENLAQYTNMLVYVPYYVSGSVDAFEFLIFPSYQNINKIVVQSEIKKNEFIANGVDENKLLTLGSPKFDAMHRVVKEQREFPFYWKETFKNKKVFLLSTGIGDLLAADTWFREVEQVLNYFIEHEECALIWRPHPLTEATVKTMRPHLVDKYEELEEKLKRAANIIVDNSSDIYPAVAASDAIISDYSSVMMQYIVTGKPVLGMLHEKLIAPDKDYNLDYLGCYFTCRDVTVPQFVEMVERNEDTKKEERITRFEKSISNPDGTCGQKVHHAIKSELMNRM